MILWDDNIYYDIYILRVMLELDVKRYDLSGYFLLGEERENPV